MWVAACAALLLWGAGTALAQPAVFDGVKLRDQQAAAVAPATLKGRLLLLSFVFTGCSTTCPLQVRELAELQRSLPADVRARVQLLSVSVDPMNDTPATLAAFARRMGADVPGWRFATGEPRHVDQLVERLQVFDTRSQAKAAPEDHRTSLYLFDAQGQLLQRYRGVPVDRVRIADEMQRALLKNYESR